MHKRLSLHGQYGIKRAVFLQIKITCLLLVFTYNSEVLYL
ncbi:hypothetical protein W04_2395 [Pseudoalteromonas sp. SW0106-04]|nr:hypothetical protein W04_2395 [Pseudoalteromonas sp. SW0106-04]